MLRLDIDYDADRAALRWLPDGSCAIEVPDGQPIVVMESSDCDVVTIPAEGQRPRCVEWITDNRQAPGA